MSACSVRPHGAGALEVELATEARPLAAAAGQVAIRAQRSVLDLRHLERVGARAAGGDAGAPRWSSLVGRVEAVGADVTGLAVGARVAAVAGASPRVCVAAERCLVVPEQVDDATAVHWALLHVLFDVVRAAPVRLADSVIVHGGGLVGFFLAQLARVAGAFVVEHAPGLPPQGAADVLFVAHGGATEPAALLSTLRNTGCAVLLDGADKVDIDLYPDLHRRSLRLIARDCAVTPCATPADAEFLRHLFASGKLVLPDRVATVTPGPSAEPAVLPADGAVAALIVWGADGAARGGAPGCG